MNINIYIKKGLQYLYDKNYRFRINASFGKYDKMDDKTYIQKLFMARIGRYLDLQNPKTFNEKLQWLKLYNRKPEYTMMSDKYMVREMIANKIGKEFLIPLIDVWNSENEIEFEKLPNKFVLKCNHNSGTGMCICRDKGNLNYNSVRRKLKKGLVENYFLKSREWPYRDIKRKIICEKYMESKNDEGLTDYKFYCFNGRPELINVSTGLENHDKASMCFMDLEWNPMDIRRCDYKNYDKIPEKPYLLSAMIKIAKKLSEGIPFIRVDLYEIKRKIYFSELTFFPCSGFIPFENIEMDYFLGEKLKLK